MTMILDPQRQERLKRRLATLEEEMQRTIDAAHSLENSLKEPMQNNRYIALLGKHNSLLSERRRINHLLKTYKANDQKRTIR